MGAAGAAIGTGRIRWLMVTLVFLVAAVAYLDRSNISIAAPHLKRDLALSDVQLGTVFSAFVLGYALLQPIAGRLADRFGARATIAAGLLWWSLLTVATALVPAGHPQMLLILIGLRFMLGVGEAVIFPAGNRLVSTWIPRAERGFATGLIFAGVGVGAGVAPPLITAIMISHDWRVAFLASAAIGLVMLVAWLMLVRERPSDHPWVNPAERAHIEFGLGAAPAEAARIVPWHKLLRDRDLALLTASYFCFGYVAYIFFSWFFSYLNSVRGMDLRASGLYAILPFAAMAIASPLGGWLSDRVTARRGARIGRAGIAAASMAVAASFVCLATLVADARLAAVVLALGSGALYFAQSAFWTLSAGMGQGSAGAVSGVMNMGGQIGGALVGVLTPLIAGRFGWPASFLAAGAVCLIGASLWLAIDPDRAIGERRT